MEPNHLTVSQTKWNKPGLFGKRVLWKLRGVRSQKMQVNLWFVVYLNQRNKSDHIFSNQSIESHCIVIGVNCIATHGYVSSVYRIVGYASRCVSHRSQLWRCTSLMGRVYWGTLVASFFQSSVWPETNSASVFTSIKNEMEVKLYLVS